MFRDAPGIFNTKVCVFERKIVGYGRCFGILFCQEEFCLGRALFGCGDFPPKGLLAKGAYVLELFNLSLKLISWAATNWLEVALQGFCKVCWH